ncbi:hypothetical protein EMIHUDRAFT_234090 [Emiliania huxleyi CCMP1516]|uniref:UBC core domain-containing protein n=2 Tax=Emiliania huxleyi TaxID=2903 RepID=A0A0D3K063_EMIH1|nr:hypothetical protein EMIHUDRAFT_234090 [Emiliania huxleyi CCMP1516]EOD29148.1 hypothetical protein EMIHUDRAFT_234090 [Emiliania huxleyi CCMP1516]|eukprot:XP_005781577.1 hypothetical protein EMIHUDRAFT_234090 [Emiliania huxleyi CCMP1516]
MLLLGLVASSTVEGDKNVSEKSRLVLTACCTAIGQCPNPLEADVTQLRTQVAEIKSFGGSTHSIDGQFGGSIVSVESLKLDFISFKDGDADVTFEALTTVNMLMYTPQSNSLPTTMENPTQKGLTSLSAPKLTHVTTNLYVTNVASLTSISFPSLQFVAGFRFQNLDALTELDLSSLVVVGNGMANNEMGPEFDDLPVLQPSGLKLSTNWIIVRNYLGFRSVPNIDCTNNAGLNAINACCPALHLKIEPFRKIAEAMSSSASRLMREERDVQNQTVPTIFAQPEETDIHHWRVPNPGTLSAPSPAPASAPQKASRAMIVGPPGTPYCLGLFHFDMRFPQDYPNSAPKSLLHDAPYHNEPSFEKDDGSGDPQRYNHKILHETLRVGVCEVMEETLETRTISANGVCPAFAHTRRQLFNMYHERYLSECERLSDEASAKDGARLEEGAPSISTHRPLLYTPLSLPPGAAFKMMPFECSSNGMSGTFGWAKIKARLLKLHESLRAEIETWRRQGAEQTRLLRASHDASVNSCVHYLLQQEERIKREIPEGASIGADPDNAWVLGSAA